MIRNNACSEIGVFRRHPTLSLHVHAHARKVCFSVSIWWIYTVREQYNDDTEQCLLRNGCISRTFHCLPRYTRLEGVILVSLYMAKQYEFNVQCSTVWCSVVQCGAVWCSVVQCGAVWCNVVQWDLGIRVRDRWRSDTTHTNVWLWRTYTCGSTRS